MNEKKLTDEENVKEKSRECAIRDKYCIRIQKAFESMGCGCDCEDIPSILVEFEKVIKEEQKTEIERLKKRHGVALLRNDDLDLENYELKKQVAELKEQGDVFKKLFENCNNSSITTDEIINTMNSFYREQAEHLAGLKVEQAVKDRVKEILDKAIIIDKNTGNNGFICIEALTELCKSKGVEVE